MIFLEFYWKFHNKVYHKQRASDYCKGPAYVLGKDSCHVILKHGAQFVGNHPVSLRKVDEVEYQPKVIGGDHQSL